MFAMRVEASRNRDSGGTGLGLAIARQLPLAMTASLVASKPHRRRSSGPFNLAQRTP
jgi:signal transduction histidine kinase